MRHGVPPGGAAAVLNPTRPQSGPRQACQTLSCQTLSLFNRPSPVDGVFLSLSRFQGRKRKSSWTTMAVRGRKADPREKHLGSACLTNGNRHRFDFVLTFGCLLQDHGIHLLLLGCRRRPDKIRERAGLGGFWPENAGEHDANLRQTQQPLKLGTPHPFRNMRVDGRSPHGRSGCCCHCSSLTGPPA
jgi:hypothetical protein